MRSKAFHAFEQKISYFNDDLDLLDVLRISILNDELTDAKSQYILKNVDATKHTHISRRRNSKVSRKQTINHLRQTVYASFVKDAYEEVTLYLKLILEKAASNGFDAGRIIGEHTFKIDATTILGAGDWSNVARLITDSVFQSLEAEKSTLKLLEKISNKLALNVDKDLINRALPYLEVRHYLIHADGLLTQEFREANKQILHNKEGYVQLDGTFICALRDSAKALVADYDNKVINADLLSASDLQP